MRTFLEYGLANAVAATALALVVLLVSYFVRRPAVRNVLWIFVLVRFVLPPMFSIPLPAWPTEAAVEVAAKPEPLPEPELIPLEAWPLFVAEARPGAGAGDNVDWPWPVEQPVAASAPTAVLPEPSTAPAQAWWPMVLRASGGVWLAGTVFVLFLAVWRVTRFRRALRVATLAPESLQAQTRALAESMGIRQAPAVLLVPGRIWPALWQPGLFSRKAQVLLPEGLLNVLDPQQRAAVLAHELAHLRRGDPWVRWLELLVSALYWWYPLVWWVRRHLHASEEACCDLWVVSALAGRRAYATALVETAAYLSGAEAAPVLASSAGPIDNLQRRVTMIMSAQWSAKLTRWGLVAVLGLGAVGLAFGPAFAQAPPAKERPRDGDDPRPKDRPRDGDRPKDGPKDGDPRPKDRPRDGDRPKDGPRDGDRPRDERPRDGDKPNPDEVNKAREAVEKARKDFQTAMEKMMEAEQRLARLEGRPARGFPGGGMPGFPGGGPGGFPGGGAGGPGVGGFPPGAGGGGVGRGPGGTPMPPGGGAGGPGGIPGRQPALGEGRGPDLRDLQQQLDEMRKALEEMRREMRRNAGERPTERPADRSPVRPSERPM